VQRVTMGMGTGKRAEDAMIPDSRIFLIWFSDSIDYSDAGGVSEGRNPRMLRCRSCMERSQPPLRTIGGAERVQS
jgi:hypothetical protein